jgi:hypothetical protein
MESISYALPLSWLLRFTCGTWYSLPEDPAPVRETSPTAQLLGQEEGLIESSLPQSVDMKRDRDEEVEETRGPILVQSSCHPVPEQRGEVDLSLVLPSMDQFLKGSFIMSQCPGCRDMAFPGHTVATQMTFNLFGSEGGAAEGTERRVDPMDLQKALRTDSLVSLFQKSLTRDIGRKQKWKPLNRDAIHGIPES